MFAESEIEGSLCARFEKMVARHGSRLAVKTPRDQLSYRKLDERANAVAAAIVHQCGARRSPIALLFEPGASDIAAIFGVLKSGNFYVPLDPSYPPARIARILEDAQAPLLLTNARNEAVARRLLCAGQSLLNTDELDQPLSEFFEVNLDAAAPAYMIYTSGSSGAPKGVLQTHRNVLCDIRRQSVDLQTTIHDRYGLLFSSSSSASVCHIFGALLNGAAVLPFDLREQGLTRFTRWLAAEEITVLDINVATFRQWCETLPALQAKARGKNRAGELFPRMRILAPGSEPLYQRDVELYRRFFPPTCLLQNALGTTETRTVAQYFLNHQTPVAQSLVPVGQAVAGKEVLLLDENQQHVREGEIGEIAVRSRYLSPGYWNRPEHTRAVFRPDPEDGEQQIYFTGDLGCYDNSGQLVHLGRKDFQVKIRGYRVEIAEVETTLGRLTGLPVAVSAFEDATGNRQLAAYLVVPRGSAADGSTPAIRALRARLCEQLPDYAVPTRFEFLDALPLTLNGKLDRRALPAPKPLRATSGEEFVKPHGRFETIIAHLYEEILAVEAVGATDDFFALGGHSLLAAQLTLHLEQEFGTALPLSAIVKAPTVRELGCFLRQAKTPRREALVPIRTGRGENRFPPLFCLPGAGGNALQFHRFASYLPDDQPVYGFDPLGLEGGAAPHTTVEAMSAFYLAEIKAVQPAPPYLLCGFSMGGLVALDIARRLRAAGEDVALLALFDTDGPHPNELPRRRNWRARLALRSRLRNRQRQLRFHCYLKRGAIVPPSLRAAHLDWLQASAAARYVPREYSGTITYFRARGRTDRAPHSLPDGGWRAATGASVEAHDIDGSHRLIQEPYVGELAQQMKCCIAQALRRDA